jgi:hypothetical protein
VTIVSDACTINIRNDASRSVNDTSRSVIDDSRVILQIVATLSYHSRGVIYKRNMFIVQATGPPYFANIKIQQFIAVEIFIMF